MDCYQDKLLNLAKREGIQGLKGEKFEDIYNKVFLKLLSENEILKDDKRQLDEWFTNAKNNIDTLEDENQEYKRANISLGNFRQSLEDEINKQKSHISELECKSMEQAKIEVELKEQLDGLKTKLSDYENHIDKINKIDNNLEKQNQDLRDAIKKLSVLL